MNNAMLSLCLVMIKLVGIPLNSTNGEHKYRVIIMCYHYMPRTFMSGSRPTLPCGGSGRELNHPFCHGRIVFNETVDERTGLGIV